MTRKYRKKAKTAVKVETDKAGKKVESVPSTAPSDNSINNSKSMLEKTEVQTYGSSSEDKPVIGKMIAFAFIIFGLIVLISVGILLIVTRISPRVDKDIAKTVIYSIPDATNEETVTIEGVALGVNRVMLFVNDKAQGSLIKVDKEGKYVYEYEFPSEGEYKFETAGVQGSIIRSRGEKSDPVYTVYDTTAPSGEVELKYDQEVTGDTIDISGKAEPDSEVVLKKGDKTYSGQADENGDFTIQDVPLDSGENKFTVEIKDAAGNTTITSDTVDVNRASVNGSGAQTSSANLPESAGELDEAMSQLFQNGFMMVIALVALALFILNSGIVLVKARRA